MREATEDHIDNACTLSIKQHKAGLNSLHLISVFGKDLGFLNNVMLL